jgi:glyoxylase-like metal-dependent hydrolase (beta-lactamase superfamily II)
MYGGIMVTMTRRLPATLAVIAAAYTWLGAQQDAVPAPLVRENALVKLGEHTWAIPDDNIPQVPNVGIVVGNRASLVIDPGLGRRNGEIVLRELARVSKNTEIYVAATHYHVEHTTGNLGFPPSAKYVASSIQDEEFVEGAAAQAKAFAARSPLHAELLKDVSQRKTDIAFDREHTLDLGGVRVRLLVVGPTHTRGDTAFFVEGDNVLFAGDVVMNNSFVAANQNSSMKAWLAAFDRFEQMDPRTIVPAHGPIGPGTLVATNRTFMREIDARVRELKSQGRTVDETAETIQKEMAAKHPTWARVNGVAGATRAAYREAQ